MQNTVCLEANSLRKTNKDMLNWMTNQEELEALSFERKNDHTGFQSMEFIYLVYENITMQNHAIVG